MNENTVLRSESKLTAEQEPLHEEATIEKSMAALAAELGEAEPIVVTTAPEYKDAPFSYSMAETETVELNSGALQHTVTDFSLPGRGGFGLTITRKYDSNESCITEVHPGRTAQISGRDNSHNRKTYGLGYGWSFVLPAIETVPESERKSGSTYGDRLHLDDGRVFEISGNKLKDYDLLDLSIQKVAGDVSHPLHEGTWPYQYVLSYKNGAKDYFKEVRDADNKLNSYKLIARKDRFDNTIIFDMQDFGGMTVIDSWGREIVLKKTGAVMTWTLPDSGTIRYKIENGCLKKVIDQENRITSYSYLPWSTNFCAASEEYGGNLLPMSYNLLDEVLHPTGAVTQYTYGWNRPNTAISLEFNEYGGARRYFPIHIRRDFSGGMEYNQVTYEFKLSEDKKYIAEADVKNANDVWENHTFDNRHLRTSVTVRHNDVIVSSIDFLYGNEEKDKKLLIQEESRQYDSKLFSAVTTIKIDYTADKMANVEKMTTSYSTELEMEQVTEFKYGEFGLVTEKTFQKDADTLIIERSTLLSPDNKLVEYSYVYERKGDTEVLKSKTRFVYDSAFRLTEEQRYYGDDLETSDSFYATAYRYDDGKHTPDPVTSELSGMKDVHANDVVSPYGNGIIRNSYDYDSCGRVTSATNPNGNTTAFLYDRLGRLIRETHPDGTFNQVVYDDKENATVMIDENGNRKRIDYTSLGMVQDVYVLQPDTLLKQFEYDSLSRLNREKSFAGDGNIKLTVAYTYDRHNRILGKTWKGRYVDQKESHVYTELWDGKYLRDEVTIDGDENAPSIVSAVHTDQAGNVRAQITGDSEVYFTYDKLGNTLSQTDPSGGVTLREYDWTGRVIRVTDALGRSSQAGFDVLGNKIRDTDCEGRETFYTYDAAGRLLVKDSLFDENVRALVQYYYDAAGNLLRQRTQTNKPGEHTLWKEIEYRYNSRGQQTDVILYGDADYVKVSRIHSLYDNIGNRLEVHTGLTERESESPAVMRYTYDRFGNILTAIDPRSNELDASDPLYREERFEYDQTGLLRYRTDRNGSRTDFFYDALDREVRKTVTVLSPSGPVTSEHLVSYTLTGQKATETDIRIENGTEKRFVISYRYDSFGRLIRQEDPDHVVKTFAYDKSGNRISFSLTRNDVPELILSYTYDKLNRLTTIKDTRHGGAIMVEYTYNKRGKRDTMTYLVNGVKTRYEYNDAGLLARLENSRGGTVISEWRYGYYLDGNQATKTALDGTVTAYSYDRFGRLLDESVADRNTYRYEYDRFGNRARMEVSGSEEYVVTYAYHPNNWLLREEKRKNGESEIFRYQYDANGNQCYRRWERRGRSSPGRKNRRLGFTSDSFKEDEVLLDLREYDGFNRLITAHRDGIRTKYQYRPDGLYAGATRTGRSGSTTTKAFLWDGANIVGEVDDGTLTAKYLRGIGLIARETSSGQEFYVFNAHGDVISLVNARGVTIKRYDFDAFGNQPADDPGDTNPFRYCGEYYDSWSGTIYLRNRIYDPRSGRFLSEDPARDGTNWYSYCGGNPLMFVDPLGLARASLNDVANAVIRGNYGNGQDRKDRLGAAGYDYRTVQNRVNQILYGGTGSSSSSSRPGSSSSSRPSGNSSSGRAPTNANRIPSTGGAKQGVLDWALDPYVRAAQEAIRDFPSNLYNDLTAFHFEGREARNNNLPSLEEALADPLWRKLEYPEDKLHQNGMGKPELKFIHPDGREVVFDGDTGTIVRNKNVYGTYNYVSITEWEDGVWEGLTSRAGHAIYDVVPHLFGGSIRGKEDSTFISRFLDLIF